MHKLTLLAFNLTCSIMYVPFKISESVYVGQYEGKFHMFLTQYKFYSKKNLLKQSKHL